MKRVSLLLLGILSVYCLSNTLSAQVKIMAKEGEVVELAEVGAIVLQKGEEVKVEFAMPIDSRPEAYREVNIQTGDVIFMANGKHVKHVKELIEIYDSLKVGDELKLALERGDQKMLVAFKKANPEDLPKRKKVIMRRDEQGKDEIIKSENVDEKEIKEILKKEEKEEQ